MKYTVHLARTAKCTVHLARTAAATACVAALLAAASASGAAAVSRTVTTGAPESLGEPQAAASSAISGVAATTFTFSSPVPTSASSAALVHVWVRTSGTHQWTDAGPVLPHGFAASYDPAIAASPTGSLLVAVGTAPQKGGCITGGSVAVARVSPGGQLGPVRLVSDQLGSGRFDDRPTIAVGPDGTVWAAWSQGPGADACQSLGTGDRIMVAVSHDGGRSFAAPVQLPAAGGTAAFGVQLAPLGGGKAAVAWTESMGGGKEGVLVSTLGPAGQVLGVWPVLTGTALPQILPAASFYDFPSASITVLPGGTFAIAAPLWDAGEGVIDIAAGVPGGRWRIQPLLPTPGSDLLLPALTTVSSGSVRLLCAEHQRTGDRLGYVTAAVRVSGHGVPVAGSLVPITPAPAGPGFFEIGEELSLTRTPTGLISAVVVAGRSKATLQTESWAGPRKAAPQGAATAAGRPTATGRPTTTDRPAAADPRQGQAADPVKWSISLIAALVLVGVAATAAAWAAYRSHSAVRR